MAAHKNHGKKMPMKPKGMPMLMPGGHMTPAEHEKMMGGKPKKKGGKK